MDTEHHRVILDWHMWMLIGLAVIVPLVAWIEARHARRPMDKETEETEKAWDRANTL